MKDHFVQYPDDNKTLWEQVFQTSQNFKGTALTFGPLKISYPLMKKRICEFSEKFYALGIRKDDVVCVCTPNIPEAVYVMYALDRIGAIAFIVHPLFPSKTLKEDLKKAKAKLFVVIDQRYNVYKDYITECPIYTITIADDLPAIARPFYQRIYSKELAGVPKDLALSKVKYDKNQLAPVNRDSHKPAFYLESGGTTGRSKIVMLSDAAVGYPAAQVPWILGGDLYEKIGTKMIGVLPMFHGFGLAMGVHAPLVWRAVSALMISYDIKKVCKMCARNQLTYLLCVPYAARKLLDNPQFSGRKLRHLTHAFVGADKPPLSLFEEFDKRMEEAGSSCRLLEGYGLTETVTVISVNTNEHRKVGSVGMPLPGTTVKAVDENGKFLPAGQEGELVINTPALMLGYLDDKEATDKAIRVIDGQKWLFTGDKGHIDEDGYIWFKDRIKNSFKIAGHNVFPADIENEVGKDERIAACGAVCIPDERHPYVHLYVQPKKMEEGPKIIEDLKKSLPETLIRYEVPEKISLIEKMPRTSIGKVDKKVLLAQENKQ